MLVVQLCAIAWHCCRSRLTHLHLQISFAACVGSHLPNLVFGRLFSVWIPSRGCKLVACCTASSLHAMSLMPLSLHRDDLTASPSVVLRLLRWRSCALYSHIWPTCQDQSASNHICRLQTLILCFVSRSTFSMQLSVPVDTVQTASVQQGQLWRQSQSGLCVAATLSVSAHWAISDALKDKLFVNMRCVSARCCIGLSSVCGLELHVITKDSCWLFKRNVYGDIRGVQITFHQSWLNGNVTAITTWGRETR